MLIPEKHPNFAPSWLYLLADYVEAKKYFPSAMQAVANKLLMRNTPTVTWDSKGLELHIGATTFRFLVVANQLGRNCTCDHDGWPCIHEYIAYQLLYTLAQRKGWRFPQPSSYSKASFFLAEQPANTAVNAHTVIEPFVQYNGNERATWRLTVEVDYHVEGGGVLLRFYRQATEGHSLREMVMLQVILNAANAVIRALTEPDATITGVTAGWSATDAQVLRYLRQFLRSSDSDFLRRKELRLSQDDFQRLRIAFQRHVGRFIRRDDQKPLPAPGQSVPTRLFFAVTTKDAPAGMFRLHAMVELPGGRRREIYDVLHECEDSKDAPLTRAEIFSARFPVSWELLMKHFARPVTTIRREKAPALLPALLNGHLELLELGENVVKCEAKSGNTPVVVKIFVKGAFFKLQCLLGEQLLTPQDADSQMPPQQLTLSRDGKLQVHIAMISPLAKCVLAEFIKIAQRFQDAKFDNDGLTLPANSRTAAFLRQFWHTMPRGVIRRAGLELKELIEGVALTAQIDINDTGALVAPAVSWRVPKGPQIDDAQLSMALSQDGIFRTRDNHWLSIDAEQAQQIRQQLINDGILSADGKPMVVMRSAARQTLANIIDTPERTHFSEAVTALLAEPTPQLPQLPPHLKDILRDYQRTGVEFISDRLLCGAGALLADDMGLGKTLQVLALLEAWRNAEHSKPLRALVICPAAVIAVWQSQAARFCPTLPTAAYIGSSARREKILAEWQNGLLVSHYGIVRQDITALETLDFDFVILDEAQNIKNPQAQATIAVKSLHTAHRIALTGTPLENSLTDLWSIMDFLNPGLLGQLENFAHHQSFPEDLSTLAQRIAPLMLRRTKEVVALQLPPRTVDIRPIIMPPEQRELYQKELVESRLRISQGRTIEIVTALTRLRQLCCAPELLKKYADSNAPSGKLMFLLEKCGELIAAGHSVLVFSQFTSMLAIIQREMTKDALPCQIITGETPLDQRARIVEDFNNSDQAQILLLSLKAAGTGLTLTRADYVFLYDPWWNPAVENQAIDRTHRIGQTRPVFAYRLITTDSVEEHVLELLREKQQLFNAVVDGATEDAVVGRLDRETLLNLLQ